MERKGLEEMAKANLDKVLDPIHAVSGPNLDPNPNLNSDPNPNPDAYPDPVPNPNLNPIYLGGREGR